MSAFGGKADIEAKLLTKDEARRKSVAAELKTNRRARVSNLKRILCFTGKRGPQVAFLKAEPRVARPEYSPHPELFNAIWQSCGDRNFKKPGRRSNYLWGRSLAPSIKDYRSGHCRWQWSCRTYPLRRYQDP